MSDSSKAFWLGTFIILALALAAWLILFLRPVVGDGEVTLRVRFSNIDKVSEGTRVTFAGRPVGEVEKILEVQDPRDAPADEFGNLYIYELILKVDSSVKVYSYDEILFASSGLLGEKSIAINPKAPPPGATPAQDVTSEILYARSVDKFEQTLTKLTNVAENFQDALEEISDFIESNNKDLNTALKSFTAAAQETRELMSRANKTDIAGRVVAASDRLILAMGKAETFFESFQDISTQIRSGEGTFSRLIQSDSLYVQFMTVLCQLQSVLYNIRTYGLLYQFDRKWQRMHRCCTEIPIEPYCEIK